MEGFKVEPPLLLIERGPCPPRRRPRTCWRDYISHLCLGTNLRILLNKLVEVAGDGLDLLCETDKWWKMEWNFPK